MKKAPKCKFGRTHNEGGPYSVALEFGQRDTYPNDFRLWVRIEVSGETHYRRGHGKFIGNFAPVWVNWRGENIEVSELLRREAA